MERVDEALVFFDKAIDFNNFNGQARYARGALLFDIRKDPEGAKKELDVALEVQEYFPEAYVKLGDILFAKKEWADGCQQYAQALVQLKQLQRPRELLAELRETVNTRLIKEARERDIAKAWMEETGPMVR
jgi:tetratricopeptide (TPR) repeat protein